MWHPAWHIDTPQLGLMTLFSRCPRRKFPESISSFSTQPQKLPPNLALQKQEYVPPPRGEVRILESAPHRQHLPRTTGDRMSDVCGCRCLGEAGRGRRLLALEKACSSVTGAGGWMSEVLAQGWTLPCAKFWELGISVHESNLSTQENETRRGMPRVPGQLGLHSEF